MLGAGGWRPHGDLPRLRIGGVGLQTLRDWVVRFNARGPEGLIDGKAPGNTCKLNECQRQAMAERVENGPTPAIHGVVRWPALLRGRFVAPLAFVARGVGHRVRLVEDDDAVEIASEPVHDLLQPARLAVSLLRAQRRIGREQDALAEEGDRRTPTENGRAARSGGAPGQAPPSRAGRPRSACRTLTPTRPGAGL